jgi:hypothetical protein
MINHKFNDNFKNYIIFFRDTKVTKKLFLASFIKTRYIEFGCECNIYKVGVLLFRFKI